MTRTMGDAIADNVPKLHSLSLDLYAGYDTGTTSDPDIEWTAADWSLFPGSKHVHIDQGYGPHSETAHVIDIEAGAWTPGTGEEAWINGCTQPRPTIYVNRSNLAASLAAARLSPKFKGDIWISFPGWTPDNLHGVLPALPKGCQYVAVQNQLDVQNAYDLSVVLDAHWPAVAPPPPPPEDPMAVQIQTGWIICDKCGALVWHNKLGSPCAAGGAHANAGDPPTTYTLIYDK